MIQIRAVVIYSHDERHTARGKAASRSTQRAKAPGFRFKAPTKCR
jgi:hypothetical protein